MTAEQRRRQCVRKHHYPTYAQAAERREELLARGEQVTVYMCLYCWQYHVGHETERHGKASERR